MATSAFKLVCEVDLFDKPGYYKIIDKTNRLVRIQFQSTKIKSRLMIDRHSVFTFYFMFYQVSQKNYSRLLRFILFHLTPQDFTED